MILYLKDQKNSNQKLLDTINSYSKVAGYKISLQKSLAFLYTNNEQTEKEYMATIPSTIASKKIKYLEVNLTKDIVYTLSSIKLEIRAEKFLLGSDKLFLLVEIRIAIQGNS
jgi:hypothetical protein